MARAPGKLHEAIAVREGLVSQLGVLIADTISKFGKFDSFFQGHIKQLKMLEESPTNTAVEKAAFEQRNLPITVKETLTYLLPFWARTEDVLHQINATNQLAKADLVFRGEVLIAGLSVDELLGLENRLGGLRNVLQSMPTLPATNQWEEDTSLGKDGAWRSKSADFISKTEKSVRWEVLYAATDHHPAQLEKIPTDKVVGTFETMKYCGACTTIQKANALAIIDDLLAAAKVARMQANCQEIVPDKIGSKITDLLLGVFA